jgi:hypothetical protein
LAGGLPGVLFEAVLGQFGLIGVVEGGILLASLAVLGGEIALLAASQGVFLENFVPAVYLLVTIILHGKKLWSGLNPSRKGCSITPTQRRLTKAPEPGLVRIGSQFAEANLITKIDPVYPRWQNRRAYRAPSSSQSALAKTAKSSASTSSVAIRS